METGVGRRAAILSVGLQPRPAASACSPAYMSQLFNCGTQALSAVCVSACYTCLLVGRSTKVQYKGSQLVAFVSAYIVSKQAPPLGLANLSGTGCKSYCTMISSSYVIHPARLVMR